jgi:hypothetical protein
MIAPAGALATASRSDPAPVFSLLVTTIVPLGASEVSMVRPAPAGASSQDAPSAPVLPLPAALPGAPLLEPPLPPAGEQLPVTHVSPPAQATRSAPQGAALLGRFESDPQALVTTSDASRTKYKGALDVSDSDGWVGKGLMRLASSGERTHSECIMLAIKGSNRLRNPTRASSPR